MCKRIGYGAILTNKKGAIIYTIQQCKIEQYYLEKITFDIKQENDVLENDFSHCVYFHVEKYNNGTDSFKTTLRAKECLLSKDELLNNLEK